MTATPGWLREHLAGLYPGARVIEVEPMAADAGATAGATHKAEGYGLPVRVVLESADGDRRTLVWRTVSANPFGHDRRADRAAEVIQAFDDFAQMPDHVVPLDVGFQRADGTLVSIASAGEPYLITTYAPGTIYADDLRRIARDHRATAQDRARGDRLAGYLAALHVAVPDGAPRYRRAARDLVGAGEGIFGIIDGYPAGVAAASADRLAAIEDRCVAWRRRLRDAGERATRTHGDFHPFNLVFGPDDELTCLDASRGGCGEPADDLTALAVNYVLFALQAPAAWPHGFGPLWRQLWERYLARRGDRAILDVAPPFFAWRALVVCNPRFYPGVEPGARDQLLGLAERYLDAGRLDPAQAEALFR